MIFTGVLMDKNIKVKGILGFYINIFLCLGLFLLIVDIVTFTFDVLAGFILFIFILIYFVIYIICRIFISRKMINELINFATGYGQIQRKLLRNLDLPYALLDEKGKIIWTNKEFEVVVDDKKGHKKLITSFFPTITKEKLPNYEKDESKLDIIHNDSKYVVKMNKISIKDIMCSSELLQIDGYDGFLIALYLYDETELRNALQEVEDKSLVVGLINLDNYDEVLETVEEVRRSLLIALIDRKVNKYIQASEGIIKKLEKDKYIVILSKKKFLTLKEDKFSIIEDVKSVNIGNDHSVTLSIGFGLDGESYLQNYEYARISIDLSLGRGGDQAVVKTPDNLQYFGGKSQQVDKNTKVKARVKAHALKEIIMTKDNVIIMGHRMTDVDSFGAGIGVYCIARFLDKKAHIIVNEISTSVQPLVDIFKNSSDYDNNMIINNSQVMEVFGNNTAVVVVDVNRPSITECPDLINRSKCTVVIDHHRQGTEAIENATLSYIEPYASSACEMVSEILQYVGDNVKITSSEADCIYSGIMIDTNNFLAKAGVRTFEAAAYLKRNGADVTRVRKMFRENAAEYMAKASTINSARIFESHYAIAVCTANNIESPTIIGAQAANELLDIIGIKASFVLTMYNGKIYYSARSIDEVNVQIIMERIGGGGHINIAGAQMENITIEEGIRILEDTLLTMINEGDI